MKISLVLLTHNRAALTARSLRHNIDSAGHPIDELVWVDNGSKDGVREVMRSFEPDVSVLHDQNLGVARGYNHGLLLATGDYLVITGSDMLMPPNWLRAMVEHVEKIPETLVACIYSKPWTEVSERITSAPRTVNGLMVQPALALERRILSREALGLIGYFHEGFGLYGWDDVEWAYRAERVAKETKRLNYALPNLLAEHLGTEGIALCDGKDDEAYHAMKRREALDPKKQQLLEQRAAAGFPYYNPYS